MRKWMMSGAPVCYSTGEGGGTAGGGAGGTGDSGAAGNNGTGNTGAGGTGEQNQNNGGTGFDPATFWNAPKSEPADPNTVKTPSEGEKVGTEFATRLQALTFGDNVFKDEVVKALGEGNYDAANTAIQTQMRNGVQQSVLMSAQLIQKAMDAMRSEFAGMIDGNLGKRDDNAALIEAFPSAKDPALLPSIKGIFDQSMKLAGGDRAKAITSTREMLKYMGKTAGSDLGITTPPGQEGDISNQNAAKALVEELLGRSS